MRNETQVAATVVALPRRVATGHPAVAKEQLEYARLLGHGVRVGFASTTATFALYVGGVLAPRVPVADLPRYWSLPVKQYLAATGLHAGWGWVNLLGHGDFANFIPIAFLAALTIPCYLAIARIFFARRDLVYGALAVLEVIVLVLAASGVLNVGAH
jgi:hypothetical protein